MSSDLFFENKKYISAKDASALTGYSKDYVGQLSRQNKVDSKKIGKVWYVSEESIVNYKNVPSELHLDSPKKSLETVVEKIVVPEIFSTPEASSEIVSELKNTTETKVISATRDAEKAISRDQVSRSIKVLPNYKQFTHEVMFGLEGSYKYTYLNYFANFFWVRI